MHLEQEIAERAELWHRTSSPFPPGQLVNSYRGEIELLPLRLSAFA